MTMPEGQDFEFEVRSPPPTNEELDGLLKQAEMYEFVVPVARSVHDSLIAEIKRLRELCGEAAGESFPDWELWRRLRAAAEGK